MGNSFKSPGDYGIEISGWGLDNCFFVERANLHWAADGEKQVRVHRALPEGAIVFVRLLAPEPMSGSVPLAYRVECASPMDRNGYCQMTLARVQPQAQESLTGKSASKQSEDRKRGNELQEVEQELEREEILT